MPTETEAPRLALFTVAPEVLLNAFGATGLVRIKSTLPADARVVRSHYDQDTFVLVIESAEFDPVAEGERIPQIQSPRVTPVPEPTLAAEGWDLAVGHGSRIHGLLVNERLALRPEQMISQGAGLVSVYRFETRADALRARQCLAELPVTTEVRPTFGGAQPRD